jgi:hypothetical protein
MPVPHTAVNSPALTTGANPSTGGNQGTGASPGTAQNAGAGGTTGEGASKDDVTGLGANNANVTIAEAKMGALEATCCGEDEQIENGLGI